MFRNRVNNNDEMSAKAFSFSRRLSKLRGGALYISILVSIILGVTLTFFILIANYNQRNVTAFLQASQLQYNLKSAFQAAQSAYFLQEHTTVWIKNPVNDDSMRINKLSWGAYLLICAETKNRHHYLSQSGLYGTYMSADTGLMVSENSRPLGLSGNVVFKAGCYIPKAGIKPAYIEGQSYNSNAENYKHFRPAPFQIPGVNAEFCKGLKQQLHKGDLFLDSSIVIIPEHCNQPFMQKTLVCEVLTGYLRNTRLSNNIRLMCDDIEIDSSAKLNNILIVCRKARFTKGFKGKVHVIASDSISMEENCEFFYPSSFVLFDEGKGAEGFKFIQFNAHCKFSGGVLALGENKTV